MNKYILILVAIVLFTNLGSINYNNAIFRYITIASLSLGILLSAILLYGEIVVLKNLRLKIGKHINTLQVGNNNESTPIQSSRSNFYKVIEVFCFSSYVVFIISLACFGVTISKKQDKVIEIQLQPNQEQLNNTKKEQINPLPNNKTPLNDSLYTSEKKLKIK